MCLIFIKSFFNLNSKKHWHERRIRVNAHRMLCVSIYFTMSFSRLASWFCVVLRLTAHPFTSHWVLNYLFINFNWAPVVYTGRVAMAGSEAPTINSGQRRAPHKEFYRAWFLISPTPNQENFCLYSLRSTYQLLHSADCLHGARDRLVTNGEGSNNRKYRATGKCCGSEKRSLQTLL